jgi:hypothetical protein
MRWAKTGGGRGTNQYAVKGVSRASRQSASVLDDLAASEEPSRMWYQGGVLLRDGAPFSGVLDAELGEVSGNGTFAHYSEGVLHRSDGPAVRRADGSEEWWLEGRRVAEPALAG